MTSLVRRKREVSKGGSGRRRNAVYHLTEKENRTSIIPPTGKERDVENAMHEERGQRSRLLPSHGKKKKEEDMSARQHRREKRGMPIGREGKKREKGSQCCVIRERNESFLLAGLFHPE